MGAMAHEKIPQGDKVRRISHFLGEDISNV
jgi:hypothetical protein